MSAQPAYHFPVEHPPRFLAHPLPADGTLTAADLHTLRLPGGSYQVVAEALAGEIFEVGEPVRLRFDPMVLLDE
jgi:hypothetical protein